jgi:hypothetical protein
LGLLKKPNTDSALAAATVRFQDDEVSVEWQGRPELLVRSPHIYLDWAVNNHRKASAYEFLGAVLYLLEGDGDKWKWQPRDEWYAPVGIERVESVDDPDVEVTITYTDQMRCKPAFRPRSAIARYLYMTFWALWNELVMRVEGDEPETMNALARDLHNQIVLYEANGVGSRGGVAPMYGAQVGAGQRLEREITTFAGITVDEFRSLPEAERDEVFERHATANVDSARQDDEEA